MLVVGESLAAWLAGVREPGLYAWQAGIALSVGLGLGRLPLAPRALLTLVLTGVGAFHAAFALYDEDDRVSALDAVALVLLVAVLAWGAWRALRDEPRATLLFALAYLAQALWCTLLLFPNTDTSAGAVLVLAPLCAGLVPLAVLALARRLLQPPRARLAPAALALLAVLPWSARGPLLWRLHRMVTAAEALAPSTALTGHPDVLLIVVDTMRADRTSLHGHERATTPSLERLATRATVYEHAQSQGIWTLPGHASLFTGLYLSEHQAGWKDGLPWCRPLRADAVTLAERFASAGYLTASIASNPFLDASFGLAQGFEWLTTPRTTSVYLWIPALAMGMCSLWGGPVLRQRLGPLERTSNVTAPEVNALALDWLARTRGSGPSFLFLNTIEVHDQLRRLPCRAPLFGDGRSFLPENVPEAHAVKAGTARLDPDHARRLADWYDSELACADQHLGELFDELERRGWLDGMLVAVTSDHGHLLGEHDAFNHEAEVWSELTHVPLIVKRPGQRVGERRAEPVRTADLAFALPRLAGLDLARPLPASLGIPVPESRWRDEVLLGATVASPPPVSESAEHHALSSWNPRYRTRWATLVDGGKKFFLDAHGNVLVTDDPWPAGSSREILREPEEEERLRALERFLAWRESLLPPLGGRPEEQADEARQRGEIESLLRRLEAQGYAGR